MRGSKFKLALAKRRPGEGGGPEVPVTNVMTVGPLWLASSDGAGGRGFGADLPDPSAAQAARLLPGAKPQPSISVLSPTSIVFTEERIHVAVLTALVDNELGSPSLGKPINCSVKWRCEGNVGIMHNRLTRVWTERRNGDQHATLHWLELERPDVHLAPAPGSRGGEIRIYLEVIPTGKPSSYDSRMLDPISYFPRDESGVVVKKIHEEAGEGIDFTNLLAFYTQATEEFAQTGRAVVGEIVDHGHDWALGRRADSAAIPWATRIVAGLDRDTGEQAEATIGDHAAFPAESYSSPGLNKLWFDGLMIDVGKTGGINARPLSNEFIVSDCEIFCSSYPAAFGAFEEYGTGEGERALVLGRMSGYAFRPAAGYEPKFTSWCNLWRNLPGVAMQSFSTSMNDIVRDISGSPIADLRDGMYGARVTRFGGYYSGLATRGEDVNPGAVFTYEGSAAWAGWSTSAPPSNAKTIHFWEGESEAVATITRSFAVAKNESVAAFCARVNDAGIPFTAADATTLAYRMDATHLHAKGAATTQALGKTRIDASHAAIVCMDIHANGFSYTVGKGARRINVAVVDCHWYGYCGAAPISASTDSEEAPGWFTYIDHNIIGCGWHDDQGYVDRLGAPQSIGIELGYFTGQKSGCGMAYCTFASVSGTSGAGVHFGVSGQFQTMERCVVGYTYAQVGNPPPEGLALVGIVSPYQSIPSAAANSKFLGSIGVSYPAIDVFTDPANGDFSLKAGTAALLPDGSDYAGIYDAAGVNRALAA